jgi:hypothetical protein
MRQYNDVLSALAEGQIVAPDPARVDDCVLFAAGFVAGAELDPEWIGDDYRWSFAVPFAYLSERFDLVPRELQEELDADSNARSQIVTELIGLVGAAYEVFRHPRIAEPQQPVIRSGPRVGRNDPCPCRSGRKFKRCCGASQ